MGTLYVHLYDTAHDGKQHLALVVGNSIRSRSCDDNDDDALASSSAAADCTSLIHWPLNRLVRGATVADSALPDHTHNRHASITQPLLDASLQPIPSASQLSTSTSTASTSASTLTSQLKSPLVRIHSECFTGETLGSVRCDCGDQLHNALAMMHREQCGVLVYLRQEGRGIGLLDKLRAYNLQDMGHDTVTANLLLNHPADLRSYDIAAVILRDLGVLQMRLLTNNPDKMEQLQKEGVHIVERVGMMPSHWTTTLSPPIPSTTPLTHKTSSVSSKSSASHPQRRKVTRLLPPKLKHRHSIRHRRNYHYHHDTTTITTTTTHNRDTTIHSSNLLSSDPNRVHLIDHHLKLVHSIDNDVLGGFDSQNEESTPIKSSTKLKSSSPNTLISTHSHDPLQLSTTITNDSSDKLINLSSGKKSTQIRPTLLHRPRSLPFAIMMRPHIPSRSHLHLSSTTNSILSTLTHKNINYTQLTPPTLHHSLSSPHSVPTHTYTTSSSNVMAEMDAYLQTKVSRMRHIIEMPSTVIDAFAKSTLSTSPPPSSKLTSNDQRSPLLYSTIQPTDQLSMSTINTDDINSQKEVPT